MVLEAHADAGETRQREVMALAWYINTLRRARWLPSLKQFLGIKPKKLTPDELEQAKADHEEALRLVGEIDG